MTNMWHENMKYSSFILEETQICSSVCVCANVWPQTKQDKNRKKTVPLCWAMNGPLEEMVLSPGSAKLIFQGLQSVKM